MQHKKIIAWDTLRIFFLISVIMYHTQLCFNSPGQNCPFLSFIYLNAGYFCNYFFFILSGILTAKIYRNKIISGNSSFLIYIKKRFSRVYPVHVVGEILAIYLLVREGEQISIVHLLKDSLFLTSGWFWNDTLPYNGPAWFICILILCEMIYYLISYLTKKSENIYISICITMMFIGGILEHADINIPFLFRINGEGYMNFFLGVSLYSIYKMSLSNKRNSCLFLGAILFLLSFLILFFKDSTLLIGDKVTVISVLCVVIICLSFFIKPFRTILEFKPLCLLNPISLELYLLHMPLLSFYFDIKNKLPLPEMKDSSYFALYLVFTISLCFLVHQIVNLATKLTICFVNKKSL